MGEHLYDRSKEIQKQITKGMTIFFLNPFVNKYEMEVLKSTHKQVLCARIKRLTEIYLKRFICDHLPFNIERIGLKQFC